MISKAHRKKLAYMLPEGIFRAHALGIFICLPIFTQSPQQLVDGLEWLSWYGITWIAVDYGFSSTSLSVAATTNGGIHLIEKAALSRFLRAIALGILVMILAPIDQGPLAMLCLVVRALTFESILLAEDKLREIILGNSSMCVASGLVILSFGVASAEVAMLAGLMARLAHFTVVSKWSLQLLVATFSLGNIRQRSSALKHQNFVFFQDVSAGLLVNAVGIYSSVTNVAIGSDVFVLARISTVISFLCRSLVTANFVEKATVGSIKETNNTNSDSKFIYFFPEVVFIATAATLFFLDATFTARNQLYLLFLAIFIRAYREVKQRQLALLARVTRGVWRPLVGAIFAVAVVAIAGFFYGFAVEHLLIAIVSLEMYLYILYVTLRPRADA